MISIEGRSVRHAMVLGLLVVLAAGVSVAKPGDHKKHPNKSCPPGHRAQMEAIAENYVNVLNEHRLDLFPTLFSEDYLLESTAGTFDGLGAVTGIMSALFDAVPDLQYSIDEILVDGDSFVLRYSYTGTHVGELFGFPGTGDIIHCTGLEIDRVEGGRIVETQNFTDLHCLLTQLAGS